MLHARRAPLQRSIVRFGLAGEANRSERNVSIGGDGTPSERLKWGDNEGSQNREDSKRSHVYVESLKEFRGTTADAQAPKGLSASPTGT